MRHLGISLGLVVLLALWTNVLAQNPHGYPSFVTPEEEREVVEKCNRKSKYRRLDGQCTNLNYPEWGKANSFLARYIPAAYENGRNKPRITGVNGGLLPSARVVSRNCHRARDAPSDFSLLLMQWGQFLDHDMTFTEGSMEDGEIVHCSCSDSADPCFNIALDNDPHFVGRTCLEFTRSHGERARVGNLFDLPWRNNLARVRQQTNTITPPIDASNVYGSSVAQLRTLLHRHRAAEMGFKRVSGQGKLLPEDVEETDLECRPDRSIDEFCFLAGDGRVNEQPGLTVLHTVFMRQHNKIAKYLKCESDLEDEEVFELTRKIIGAIMQKITYSDFLPLILSHDTMVKFGLSSDTDYEFNGDIRPDIFNAFATAVYRFGHSLIPEIFNLGKFPTALKDMFFRPTEVLNGFSAVSDALKNDGSLALDRNMAAAVTNHLFQNQSETDGTDLASLNIQRGRDHGLPSFTKYREYCNLTDPITLEDLFDTDADALATYDDIEDVDIFTGILSEKPGPNGGLLGPTFECLMGQQFAALKFGDRFFYQNRKGKAAFTRKQIAEIEKITLSKIMCDNTEIREIQTNAFFPADDIENPSKRCGRFDSLDLSVFAKDSKDSSGSYYYSSSSSSEEEY